MLDFDPSTFDLNDNISIEDHKINPRSWLTVKGPKYNVFTSILTWVGMS